MKINWKSLIFRLLVPLAVGGISALLTRESMGVFALVEKPPLSPPGWLFPVAWTLLYLLMGYADYRVAQTPQGRDKTWFGYLYGAQLFFNFFWSLIFFNLRAYGFALGWLAVLWVLILGCLVLARRVDKTAFWCLLPYLLWVSFAAYLNAGVAWLN